MRTLALALSFLVSGGANGQVTLPLSEYETLKKNAEVAKERVATEPSLTIIETARLAGRFRGGPLTLSFQGRAVGARPAVSLLALEGDLQLSSCRGSGIVSNGENGDLMLTPLSNSIEVTCRLSGVKNERLEMILTKNVLGFSLDVKDAEIAAQKVDTETGSRTLAVAWVDPNPEIVRPSATGRYRLTIHPDETRFRYQFELSNPNRSRQPFELSIPAGESIQQVEGPSYETRGGTLRFDLPPGESKIALTGTRHGASFTPPVEAAVQFALVEAHPLLRCLVTTVSRRVSPAETGLTPTFPGGDAFLVRPHEQISWSIAAVDSLKSDSFAVGRAEHLAFLPADGPMLLESRMTLQNRGAAELTLAVDGTPRYASIDATPTLLRPGKGGLSLPLSPGSQIVTVQASRDFRQGLGVGLLSFRVPAAAVPVSTSVVELRYAPGWIPLFESFSSERRFALPQEASLLWFVLLGLATERALAVLRLSIRARVTLALLITTAGLTSAVAFQLSWIFSLSIGVAWILARTPKFRLSGPRVGAAVAAFVILFLVGSMLSRYRDILGSFSGGSGGLGSVSAGVQTLGLLERLFMPPIPRGDGFQRVSTQTPAPANTPQPASYQGLPSRLEIPEGLRRTLLVRELLPANASPAVRVIVLSTTVVWWIVMGLYAVLARALYQSRACLLEGLTGLVDRPKEKMTPAPGPPPDVDPVTV